MEKSAITDHLEIDWEGARVVEREIDWRMHKSKKAIQIRLQGVDYEPGPGGGGSFRDLRPAFHRSL